MPSTGNAAWYFLHRHLAEGNGDRLAFLDPHRRLTYAGLAAASARFAGALTASGIGRERRVALVLLDTVDFPVAFWGAIAAGVIPVPVNTLLTPEQTAYILADSRAEALVVSAPLAPALRPLLGALPALRRVVLVAPDGSAPAATGSELGWDAFLAQGTRLPAPVDASPDEVAFWLYSSGSTGLPKGARHLHASLQATAETYAAQVLGLTAEDVVFSAAKLFFAYGLGNAMGFPLWVGGTTVLMPDRPTPESTFAAIERFRPSVFFGVPTLFARQIAEFQRLRPDLSSLRFCVSAGEALPAHLLEAWRRLTGTEIIDGIGSTEATHMYISNRPGDVKPGSTGRAVPGYELKIVDEQGAELPPGCAGRLLVRGESIAKCYWRNTRPTLVDGWLDTGDTYRLDADGTYTYSGRSDDMLKVGGIWCSPVEIEAVLIEHPGVLEAAVVGREDADGLVKPEAWIVPSNPDGAVPLGLEAALVRHCKARLAPYKYPRWVHLVPDLPKTATGKIQRFVLRQRPPPGPAAGSDQPVAMERA